MPATQPERRVPSLLAVAEGRLYTWSQKTNGRHTPGLLSLALNKHARGHDAVVSVSELSPVSAWSLVIDRRCGVRTCETQPTRRRRCCPTTRTHDFSWLARWSTDARCPLPVADCCAHESLAHRISCPCQLRWRSASRRCGLCGHTCRRRSGYRSLVKQTPRQRRILVAPCNTVSRTLWHFSCGCCQASPNGGNSNTRGWAL